LRGGGRVGRDRSTVLAGRVSLLLFYLGNYYIGGEKLRKVIKEIYIRGKRQERGERVGENGGRIIQRRQSRIIISFVDRY